jgi:hypothetical protein
MLLTLVVLCSDALHLQAGKATTSSDAMPPSRNCSADFQTLWCRYASFKERPGFGAGSSVLERVLDGGFPGQIHSPLPRGHSPLQLRDNEAQKATTTYLRIVLRPLPTFNWSAVSILLVSLLLGKAECR